MNADQELVGGIGLDYEATPSVSFRVVAADRHGAQDSVLVNVNVTDVDEPPHLPGGVVVTADSSSQLAVQWEANRHHWGRPPIDGYRVRYRAELAPWTTAPYFGTVTNTVLTGLEADTEYQVQVQAVNDEGDSTWSNTVLGRTQKSSAGGGEEAVRP